MRFLRIASVLLALSAPLMAQTPSMYIYPDAASLPTVPKGTYQPITVVVNGVNNKTVTWTTTGGTLVGTNPCVVNEPCTISLFSSTTGGPYTVTATSNANGTTTATTQVTFGASPTPATNHPRLFVTAGQLSGLQAKGTSGNGVYNDNIFSLGTCYYSGGCGNYSSLWTPSTWSGSACTGGTFPTSDLSADTLINGAWWLTNVGLFDNSSSNRNTYGCLGRDAFLINASYVLNGKVDLSGGNPWSDAADEYSFTPDWLMGAGYLSANDWNVVRQFWLMFMFGQINDPGDGNNANIGGYNSATQFFQTSSFSATGMRASGNNYTNARVLVQVAGSLTFNDNTTDDPTYPTGGAAAFGPLNGGSGWAVGDQFHIGSGGAVAQCTVVQSGACLQSIMISYGSGYTNSGRTGTPGTTTTAISPSLGTGLSGTVLAENTCGNARDTGPCADGTVPNLHAYWPYVTGGMIYRDVAAFEDPGVTQPMYNAAYSNMPSNPSCNTQWGGTVPCLGEGRGGEATEGTIYGNSTARLREAFTSIKTAGYNDPIAYGPQMGFGESSWWWLRYVSDVSLLTGYSGISSQASRWNMLTNGDSLTYYTYPNNYEVTAFGLADLAYSGITSGALLNGYEWLLLNSSFGGASGTQGSCTGSCGFLQMLGNSNAANAGVGAFIAFPSSAGIPSPTDPRSTLPTDWFAFDNQHVILRDGTWGNNTGTIFNYYGVNTFINHEHEWFGGFDIYSGGEYITKGRMEVNNYNDGQSVNYFHNAPSLFQSASTCPPPSCLAWQAAMIGGQFWQGQQQGMVNVLHSELPTYAAISDQNEENAFNGGNSVYSSYNAVTAASTDHIYLRSLKQLVSYSRGTTSSALEKSLQINTTGNVTISGNTGTYNTISGTQSVAITSLLPAGATLTNPKIVNQVNVTAPFSNLQNGTSMQLTVTGVNGDGTTTNMTSLGSPYVFYGLYNQFGTDTGTGTITSGGLFTGTSVGTVTVTPVGYFQGTAITVNVVSGASSGSISQAGDTSQEDDWELRAQFKIDAGSTTTSRFLTVTQWGASGFTPVTATAASSSSGQAYDGAIVGTTAEWFMQTKATFTGVTFPASGATTAYVANLTPNTSYTVTGTGTSSPCVSDNAGVCVIPMTGTGSITIGAASTSGGVTIQGGVTLSGNVVIQ